MKNLHWILVIFLFVSFAACGDKKEVIVSKTDLISRKWQIHKFVKEGLNSSSVLYERDKDTTEFNLDRFSLNLEKNGNLSGTDIDGSALMGSWALTENETQVTMTIYGDMNIFSIERIEAESMRLNTTQIDNFTGENLKYIYFFKPM
jgi:hypothetical protein